MKSIDKGWIRSCKTHMAVEPASRSVYREAIKLQTADRLVQQDTVAMAKGIDGEGRWWAPQGKGK